MPQATDVLINGAGYMIEPGTYERSGDAEPERRSGRWKQTDFIGGMNRALQLEQDTAWIDAGVGPALRGQGVEPWPYILQYGDAGIVNRTVTLGQRAPSTIAGTRAYYGNGRYFYETPPLTNPTWTGMNQKYDAGAGKVITDVSQYQDNIAICLGTGLDIQIYDVTAGTTAALLAGEKGGVCAGYAGRLLYSNPAAGSLHQLRLSTGGGIDTRLLDSPIARMALHAGKAIIATRSSLYQLGGKSDPATGKWLADPEPLFTSGNWCGDEDYVFLLSFAGKLYTWLNGQVMQYEPSAGSNRQGWTPTGIEGRACYGATVAGGYLFVATIARGGRSYFWALDTSGGWWLASDSGGTNPKIWPMNVAGAGTYDLVSFFDSSAVVNYFTIRTTYRDATNNPYKTAGTWRSSLIDAGEPDATKSWYRLGCSFETPTDRGNSASVDAVTVTLSYSVDNGSNWTTHLTASPTTPNDRTLILDGLISGGALESRRLQLKVDWSSVVDWAPTLTGVWADYDVEAPERKRRRRWKFKAKAADHLIQRDSAQTARTGAQLAADLWSNYLSGQTLTFRDIDYDTSAVQRSVRLLGIKEMIPKTQDAGRWGESVLELTLAEA